MKNLYSNPCPDGHTLPPKASYGDTFFHLGEGQLYHFNAGWKPMGPQQGPSLPTHGMQAGDWFLCTSEQKLYRFDGAAWTRPWELVV